MPDGVVRRPSPEEHPRCRICHWRLLSLVDEVSGTGSSPAGESPQMAADANSTTKWLTFAPTATLTYRLSEPASITGYALTFNNLTYLPYMTRAA